MSPIRFNGVVFTPGDAAKSNRSDVKKHLYTGSAIKHSPVPTATLPQIPLISGSREALTENPPEGAALRTEHDEIATYEACISMAHALQLPKLGRLLTANLKEELASARKIAAAASRSA
jgi:hypothetical protein